MLEETAPVDPGGATRLKTHKIRVEVLDGPDRGLVTELTGPEARIGSGAAVSLVLKDHTVSRLHLTLRIEGDAIRVVDEGSRNGTILDGTRVRDAWARPNSTLRLGDTTLCLRMLDEILELPVSPRERMGGMLGRSVAMRRVFSLLEQIAPTDARLLIEGETGTGKELVAEAVHGASRRADRPLVVVDCSTVSPTLIESELFGHLRGSFTGAVSDRAGAFESADGGTVFLDEIGELPLDLQPNLLRVLERGEVRRVGANTHRPVDVRVIAATNRALAQEVERGRFREDLYYRLAVITVRMPPLRERPDDIALLARHFEALFAGRVPGAAPLPDTAMTAFMRRSWPGNIRELRNAVERALLLGRLLLPSGTCERVDAPAEGLHVDLSEPLYVGVARIRVAYEKACVQAALEQTGGNISNAARILQVDRKSIQRIMNACRLRGDPTTSSITLARPG
jgi:transcriptional regulator with GAF, ATPase, and Fis domain